MSLANDLKEISAKTLKNNLEVQSPKLAQWWLDNTIRVMKIEASTAGTLEFSYTLLLSEAFMKLDNASIGNAVKLLGERLKDEGLDSRFNEHTAQRVPDNIVGYLKIWVPQ
jgi:hypothetical protein